MILNENIWNFGYLYSWITSIQDADDFTLFNRFLTLKFTPVYKNSLRILYKTGTKPQEKSNFHVIFWNGKTSILSKHFQKILTNSLCLLLV